MTYYVRQYKIFGKRVIVTAREYNSGCDFLLLNNMNFQIIKINRIYKVILIEPCLVMFFEFLNIMIQPDWLAKIEFIADRVQSIEDLMRSGIIRLIADYGVAQHMIVFKFFSP